jgi:hypothetical protein
MRTINCYVPIKVCVTGRPSDAQLDELGAALARALAERLAFAERTITARFGLPARRGAAEVVRAPDGPARRAHSPKAGEPLDRSRVRAHSYLVPSYDQQGQLTPVALPGSAVQAPQPAPPLPATDDIKEMVRKRFPATQGRPDGDVHFGVYVQAKGDVVAAVHFLVVDAQGKESLDAVSFVDVNTGQPVTARLAPGTYNLLIRPHGEAQLYRDDQLLRTLENPDNLDRTVTFFVPPGPGAPGAAQPVKRPYHLYPRLQVLRLSAEQEATTGAEGVYLAAVEIWRVDDADNWGLVPGLAWVYAFVSYRWEIWKLLPPAPGEKASRRVRVHAEETHNAFLHHTWTEDGSYDVECEAAVRYEDASPRPVRARHRESVIKLETKQALLLAQLEKEQALAEADPKRTPVWFKWSFDLLDKYEDMLKQETNEARKRALEDAIRKMKQHLFGGTTTRRFGLRAIFTEKKTSETKPLTLFIGPSSEFHPQYKIWKLIDLTYPPFYRTYTGRGLTHREAILAAFEDARTTFHDSYPPGRILARLEFEGMDQFGLVPQDFAIETESWQRTAYEWLSLGAQALGAVSLAAAFVFPPSALVTGVIIIGATAGALVSVANIVERIQTDSFEWDATAVADLVNIAASFALVGGVVARGAASGIARSVAQGESLTVKAASRLAALKNIQKGMLFMGLTADVSNGVLLSYETYLQIRDADAAVDAGALGDYQRIYGDEEGRRRWELERQTRILGILARAAVGGVLTAVAIRGSARALGERPPPTAPGAPPPPPATQRVASATTADGYLDALRAEQHTAESVGRRWDYDRFPQGPPNRPWQPGDPVDMPTATGEYPRYDAGPLQDRGRNRFWRNRAHFELEARARGDARHDPNSSDPIRRLPDADLQAMRNTGNSPPDPHQAGRVVELEHAGVPQRVRKWLERLGFTAEEASRLTGASDPGALLEATRLEHGFFDVEAWKFGGYRADVAGQRWAGTAAADVRAQRPLAGLSDATITRVVQQARARNLNFNQNDSTRKLRDALRAEINARGLSVTPP